MKTALFLYVFLATLFFALNLMLVSGTVSSGMSGNMVLLAD